jgi:hypothetical protein
MKQPRQRAIEPTCSCSSDVTEFTPPLRQLRGSRRPIAGSADPIASIASVVERVIEEEELQDSGDEDPDADQMGRN